MAPDAHPRLEEVARKPHARWKDGPPDVFRAVPSPIPDADGFRLLLMAGGLEVAPLDLAVALAAGALRARRYRERQCEISMGDCVAAALAASRARPLATADPHLATAAWAEGIRILPLPDTRGRRPRPT